jgi:hypothetical protein
MKKLSYLLFIMLLSGCYGQNCKTIANSFQSPAKAISVVDKSKFNFKESINTSKSSWIIELSYYSCDKKTGFLIMETKSQKYIHQEVPFLLWEKLKEAHSFGTFYNTNIRGKYRLRL